MKTDRHARFMALLLGTASACAVLSTPAAAQERQRFDIRSQDAAQALNEYARQAGVQIVFPYDRVRGRTTPDVQGDLTRQEALAMLTDGMGLAVTSDAAGMVTLRGAADPQSGSAAGDGADGGTVEALIVTAQKREEDIQDVPIAISAFTQEDLTRSQVTGGPDLITQVPNMTFTKTNFSSYSVQLRGIGTQAISATTDPAVAVAFNNTPFIRNRFFEQEFYDLQRVEVLRGPQGTLYGRNATAGVVNIISQKPKFVAEAKVSGDIGNYGSSRVEGMINIPLVEDAVALRVAGAWTKRDGYVTNELAGEQTDGRDLWSTRVSLRISPNDRIDANLIWEHFEEDDDRLRSGKQLCKKDVVTQVGDAQVTNYYDARTSFNGANLLGGVQQALSQGCRRNSLYARDSFQRPNGLMLPYYFPLGAIGLPDALTDPFVSVVDSSDPVLISETNDQPEDWRVIQSTVSPKYRAASDLGEIQVRIDLSDTLTLTSETAYGTDTVYSLQDFNRFATAPRAWAISHGFDPYDPNTTRPTQAFARGVLDENGVFCDPQLGCSDRLVVVDISTAKATQFSQELRLASDFDGPFNFSIGGNFLRADSEDKYYVFFNSISLIAASGPPFNEYQTYVPGVTDNAAYLLNGYLPGDPNAVYNVTQTVYIDPNPIESVNDEGHNYFLSKNPYKLISYAIFGEAYYNIAENLKITAGLRWTVDKKEAPRVPTWILASQSVGYPVAEVIEQEWREPTGRLAVDWKPDLGFTDDTMIYGSYAHGYKAGGANPPGFVYALYGDASRLEFERPDSATRPKVFDPEFLDAFELGAKNTLADGQVTLNLAAFYYDYTGYQVSEIVDRSAYNRNFDATVWGIELESDWRPVENLKFGLKVGYEKTRIKDGEQAIDLMDRTAGDPNWVVARPFPTYASSCILPTFVFENPNGTLGRVGGMGGGGPGGCEIAYGFGWDPVTHAPYVDIANGGVPADTTPIVGIQRNNLAYHPGYPGWDPSTAPNGGEGIMKPLGGNALPNAPEWTATITGDYTIPMPNDWLATLHTDLHWQSESWWRIFDDHDYNKLDEYFTMNLAAIFTNEDAGWNIMAYIKNVTDETAITGAFLNSDDTGLTTNIFLTEPRLYGLRVTKNWTGGPLWGSFGAKREGYYPFTVELGGQVQRHDASNATVAPSFAPVFQDALDIVGEPQDNDLDWGDGRDVKVTWRPSGPWSVSAGVRFGKTNGYNTQEAVQDTEPACLFYDQATCDYFATLPGYEQWAAFTFPNNAQARISDREEHQIVDFAVGYDAGFGGLSRSRLSAVLRHASLESETTARLRGLPDRHLEDGFLESPNPIIYSLYNGETRADRSFDGWGPVLAWDAAYPLINSEAGGRLELDWSIAGGVLMGDREVSVSSMEKQFYREMDVFEFVFIDTSPPAPDDTIVTTSSFSRADDATVPTAAASLGLSYTIGGFTAGAGYRWERYFDAIDGGFEEAEDHDRTIDGPYFKIAVGFGG